jgi:ribosomal protein S18 acetylase RimI-like enzyme
MEDELQVRAYDPSDENAVVALWDLTFPDEPPWNEARSLIARKLTTQPDLFFVCVIGNEIVGTAIAGYDGVRGWVHKVATHPDNQGQGIGRRLMSHAETALRSLGCVKLNLQVRSHNDPAAHFYTSIGYELEERISMSKHLD